MNQLNLVVMEKAAKEFTGRKIESLLEERSQHHNFFIVGSGDIYILSRPPLEDGTGGEKMILNELEERALINS
jgi:hypothetical protein